jgi:prepilin-type processing-associated H-X9-DG protein
MKIFRSKIARLGFTVVELLVTLGTVGLLLSLILPAIQKVRESAARIRCLSNLKQIGLALHNYHGDHRRFPPLPAKSYDRPTTVLYWDRMQVWLGWMGHLLPYIEEDKLFAKAQSAFQVAEYPWVNPPHTGFSTVLRLYVCPNDARLLVTHEDPNGITAAFTSYLGVSGGERFDGVLGTFFPGISLGQITDGASNTLMVGERPPPNTFQAGWWYTGGAQAYWTRGPESGWPIAGFAPWPDPCQGRYHYGPGRIDNPCDRFHFWGLHPRGANFLFADGSTRYLPYSAEPVMIALGTRAGGETVDLSEFE